MSGLGQARIVTDEEVRALAITPAEVQQAIMEALAGRRAGTARVQPKAIMQSPPGSVHFSMPAALGDIAMVKWLSHGPGLPVDGAPFIHAAIMASSAIDGRLLAVLDAGWITAIRTAAVSLVGLRLMGVTRAEEATIVGCGLQARVHVEALAQTFGLERLRLVSRRRESAQALADLASAHGARSQIIDADGLPGDTALLITAIPVTARERNFIDAGALAPGATAVVLDNGVSFVSESGAAFDYVLVDDRDQTEPIRAAGKLPLIRRINADLFEREDGRAPPPDDRARKLFLPHGMALADAAVTRLVLRRLDLI